jgi:hypothetical protein
VEKVAATPFFLADESLVLEPTLDRRTLRQFGQIRAQHAQKIFLKPSTIAAGAIERPKISGLLLLALIAEAQHAPWNIALVISASPASTPMANRPGADSAVTVRWSENITTIP